MPIAIDITIDESLVTARKGAGIVRDARRAVLLRHKMQTIKRHFMKVPETEPGGAYGYTPRSRRYRERKEAKGRGRTPNVYSGRLRANVLQRSRVTATQKRARFIASNAGHFALNAQRRKELEAVSPREQTAMAKQLGDEVTKAMNDPKNQRKRKRKIS